MHPKNLLGYYKVWVHFFVENRVLCMVFPNERANGVSE